MKKWSLPLALLVFGLPMTATAQDRQSLETYLGSVSRAFVADPDGFMALYGPSTPVERVVRSDRPRTSGEPRIIRLDERAGTATVLLSGHAAREDSGNATSASLEYSGLHRLRWSDAGWKIESRVPFQVNCILSHDLTVDLDPAQGFSATDQMKIAVDADQGFFFGLNTGAKVKAVQLDGRPAAFVFQDGFLWLDAAPGPHRLRIEYEIAVERQQGGNSGMFSDAYGHLRNQYWWHPFFGFGVDQGLADFRVTVRAPERVKIAMDVPQTEEVVDGQRRVTATSTVPTGALTWAYDEAWTPSAHRFGDMTLELYATPNYTPKADELVAAAERTWSLLAERFGQPEQHRIAVVQARGRSGNGWHFLSNQAIFTGAAGGAPSRGDGFPVRAFFDHEVAHLWTRPSGRTRNFLSEGWATYAESLVIADRYGAEAARWFWTDQARLFLTSPGAVAGAMGDDASNSGVSYAKGAWTLAMLERTLGRDAFDRGMRAFVAAPLGKTDYDDFIRSFGPDADKARRFLTPWVEGRGAPRITVEREGDHLVLVQNGDVYWLPGFAVAVERRDGSVDWMRVDLEGERTEIGSGAGSDVVRVRLDPAGDYLLLGDRVAELAKASGS